MAKNYDDDENMTVELELEDGQQVTLDIITIISVDGEDYIALSPQVDDEVSMEDREVWFYGYSENPDDPNEEPELRYIEDDDEYDAVADAFDEWLDNLEFMEEWTGEED